jgi:predicted dehydrogenase
MGFGSHFPTLNTLGQHPDVDLVTVSVKVPDRCRPVMAAIEASKHVYCEWPLGRDTDETVRLLDCRRHLALQAHHMPDAAALRCFNYAKHLVAEGYVGRVLTATMIGCAPNWGATIDRAYQAERANGANLLTITGGHQIDAMCYCLGELRELTAFAVSQRDRIPWRNRRQGHAGSARGERHRRRLGGRVVSDSWRDDPRHRVPVRDPRRSG